MTQLGDKLNKGLQYASDLQTTNKTIIGAINELKQSGSSILSGTTAPTAQQGSNGSLYVQYTEGTGGADDTVDALFVKLDGTWCEISTGSGGTGYTDVTGTLTAGATSLTLQDASITTTSTINVFTEGGVDYNSITVSTGSVTLTFDAQQSNLDVKVRVWATPPQAEGSAF